jgi:enamine deaminase RidA (YjgF/YER057c/UK114 family)
VVRDVEVIHHKDARDVWMPYAPGIKVNQGKILFVAGCTAAPVYHSHPHIPEEFASIPNDMGEQTRMAYENVRKTVEAAGGTMDDIVDVTRFIVNMDEQDQVNAVHAEFFGNHLPASTTIGVSCLATDRRCKIEVRAIAVIDDGR